MPKRKQRDDDRERGNRDDKHLDAMLDDALENTFPASDPVSIVQPKLTATNDDD
jgi:hypothetical protein